VTNQKNATPLGEKAGASRRTVVLALAGATVAGLAAPRAARAMMDKTGGARLVPAAGDVVSVDMNNALTYVPDQIRIKVGDTVEWRNVESFPHSVTADASIAEDPGNVELPDGAEPFNSGRIDGGSSWRHTFTVPGTYRYFCIPHEAAGMLGTVIVEA
jgi:plastocyanin